jgi:hypothetical protein
MMDILAGLHYYWMWNNYVFGCSTAPGSRWGFSSNTPKH